MDLSVIIVNFNTKDVTDECLRRVRIAADYSHAKLHNETEVLVIDNASTDDSVEMIKDKYPWVTLITSSENVGFCKANNIGLKKATKPYILLLNSDAYVQHDAFVKALEFYKSNPDTDILGCRLTYKDGSFQGSAGHLPTALNNLTWQLGIETVPIIGNLVGAFHPRDPSFFNKTKEVGWVIGAFFMLTREVYETIGGFDEHIFMYAEEVELCMRAKKQGFRVIFTPSFSVVHLGSASSFDIQRPLYMELKSMLYIFEKHYPSQVPLFKVALWAGCWIRIIAFTFMNLHNRRKAYIEALKLL